MRFNENTRVKFPAIIQFMRLGYEYLSLKTLDYDRETRIITNKFHQALEKINKRKYTADEISSILNEIDSIIKNNDMGKGFYEWLINPIGKTKLIDFDNIDNNNFAVVSELFFGKEVNNSFRPDVTIFINGIPLAFLEVKIPNNMGGIQAEFHRMLDERLKKYDFKKYFNLFQIVSFSNNMEYENPDDSDIGDVKAGSFYTTPNGDKTTFSFFREEKPKTDGFYEISPDQIKYVLKDKGESALEFETAEFQTNLSLESPCNSFITSIFAKERILYLLQYGIIYVDKKIPEKHIMRYPQLFASQEIMRRLDLNIKSGIIFHTQGSGKTELAALSIRILKDYFAKRDIVARFYYVVDRLDLLTQVSGEMTARNIQVTNVSTKKDFGDELKTSLNTKEAQGPWGDLTVVNIQKFADDMPTASNVYNANIQRIFFIDEAHRSYSIVGEFFKNLMLTDRNAVFLALTGTPLLSAKERSNLKFGDYIHKYFYDKSIADGYTLRIKKEAINTVARSEIRNNLRLEEQELKSKSLMESDAYINELSHYIDNDFHNFRLIRNDNTIGGMIVCCSNLQAKKVKDWFNTNSDLETGLVITDESIPSKCNKKTQISFKETFKPDILIVHQMLTTGYDVNRLKKMYLLRNSKEHTLLQTISRVNRPYRSPVTGQNYHYGYITDFVDIEQEYDRTIEMYQKELEEGFNDASDEAIKLGGMLVSVSDIDARYQQNKNKLDEIIDTSNKERFTTSMTRFNKDTLLEIRKYLKNIKNCHVEFALSMSEKAKEIDISHIKSLLKIVQNRIDFINLKTRPVDFLSIISNTEVVEILYTFILSHISILDLSKINDIFKKYTENQDVLELKLNIEILQNGLKKAQHKNQIEIITLEEVLRKIFDKLDISDLSNINEINMELRNAINELDKINKDNEILAKRYGGLFSFVKTYRDMVETHPEYDPIKLQELLDIIYKSVSSIKDNNIIILQGRDNFVASIKKTTASQLFKSGLREQLNLKEWLDTLLHELYSNMRIF